MRESVRSVSTLTPPPIAGSKSAPVKDRLTGSLAWGRQYSVGMNCLHDRNDDCSTERCSLCTWNSVNLR